MYKKYYKALTIAGSDSGGGAGIQADLKTFSALGCYGASVITAVTAQNTIGVRDIHPIPAAMVKTQIEAVLEDVGADAIKIGMLHSAEVIDTIAAALKDFEGPIVLDPVMVATSGDSLLERDSIGVLKSKLIPLAALITPNIPEAEILIGGSIRDKKDMRDAAKQLSSLGATAVLLKAGHLSSDVLVDIFYDSQSENFMELSSKRINTCNTHGTGCTLSSAVAAFLARGCSMPEAVESAKDYISKAIKLGSGYRIGTGNGPVHHFHGIWD